MRTQDSPCKTHFDRAGMVARWRPVHRGHVPVLRGLCRCYRTAVIGIGSANRYDFRNPFTYAETADMIRLMLPGHSNYELIPVPDLDDGPRWQAMILELFGSLDVFYTDNPYVAYLLAADYRILKPVELVAPAERLDIDGTTVRRDMASGDAWKEWVPKEVADYIGRRKLDLRFRREFGLQTLALATMTD